MSTVGEGGSLTVSMRTFMLSVIPYSRHLLKQRIQQEIGIDGRMRRL